MNLTDEEKDQMYQELLDAVESCERGNYPQPNITSKEYANEKGITVNAAYRRLERAANAGRMEKSEQILVDGNWCFLYWKKIKPTH